MTYNKYAYKNDEEELVNICQYIRDNYPHLNIKREWFILFDDDMNYLKSKKDCPKSGKIRNPDILIFKNNYRRSTMEKPLIVIEIDGAVHDKYMTDTEQRNDDYKRSKLPLEIITKSILKKDIYEAIDDIISKYE